MDGSILCAIDGRFTYEGLTQTSNPNSNAFFAGCNFFGEGEATFVGHTVFEGPISGVAHGPVTFDTLACEGPHSDMICYAGATHTSSTCASCP